MLEGKKKTLSLQTKKSIFINYVGKFTFKLKNHRVNHHVNGIKKKNEKKPIKSPTFNNDEKFVTFF
jgi:hypothetical protein